MSEQHTNVDGDLNGNALSGSFSGPVQTGQTVTVNVQREPEQPRTAREYLDAMWKILLEDQRQRRERQLHNDRWFWIIGVGLLITFTICIFNSLWIWQLVSRFEWLWQ